MTTITETTSRPRLGLPLPAIVGLALLAVPRVVLHDLGLLGPGSLLNLVLVFGPPLVWIAVALWRGVPRPFLTLLAVGVCYGVLLAIGHQVLWEQAFAANPPQLGGNLAGLEPAVQQLILRGAAAISSLFTGTIVGAIAGLVAWGLQVALRRGRR